MIVDNTFIMCNNRNMGTNKTNRPTHPFAGARKMKPTKKHRPAIWENMLGTVMAMNAEGVIKYFDYDWDGAREFAGVTEDSDPRVFRNPGHYSYGKGGLYGGGPRRGQLVLWIIR